MATQIDPVRQGVGRSPGGWRYRARPASWRSAWWAWRTLRRARGGLPGGLDAVDLRAPPPDARGRRAVTAVLHRMGATCLERSLVLQRWDAAHGRRRDVIIGVAASDAGIVAHAWLDGDPAAIAHREIARRPARGGG